MRTPLLAVTVWTATAVVACVVLAGCGKGRTVQAQSVPAGWPVPLRFNMTSSSEDPDVRAKRLGPLKVYLERELGIPVEITANTGYGGTIEAMRAHRIDAAGMGPFAYLIAAEKAGAEAIVSRGLVDGTPGVYAGSLAVPGNSTIRNIDDLKRNVRDLTISFVDPASASGYLVQRAYLDSIGINPEKDFRKVVFSNNHMASLMTLKAGKVDVAAVQSNMPSSMIKRGRLKEGEIRQIWISPPIPNSPVAVRKDLPADLKRKLQDALANMRTKVPDVYANIYSRSNSYYATQSQNTTYVRVSDATFDGLRRMARGVRTIQLLEE